MEGRLAFDGVPVEQDRRLSDVIAREQTRLRQFIRARVRSDSDAEDIFQEVFYELVDAYRLTKPLEQVGAWLFRVARNRISDLFRAPALTPVLRLLGVTFLFEGMSMVAGPVRQLAEQLAAAQ